MKRRALLTAFLTALAGCAATEGSSVSGTNINDNVTRFVDEEAGVVIYTFDRDGYASGMTAIPIEDTDLAR